MNINAQTLDRSIVPQAGPAPKIQIGSYESFSLPNGLKVFVVENRKIPIVSLQLSIDADPLLEGDKIGAMSMMGQLIKRGTTQRSKQKIDEEIDFLGASLSTTSTGIFARSMTKHLPNLLDIMSDVLLDPIFPETELEKIRKQKLSELAAQQDDATAIARNVGRVLRYGKEHPYGEVVSEETINNIEASECKTLYETFFRPNISYLVIVGDISVDEAKPLVEQYFGSWEKGKIPSMKYDMPEIPDSNKVTFVDKMDAPHSFVMVTYPIHLEVGSEDAIKASVLNEILGGGSFSARLMQNLREDKGFTYGAYSRLKKDELVGFFSAGASVRNEVTDSALVELLKEMRLIVREPVTIEELQLTKNVMTGDFARSLENPQTITNFALNTARYKLPKDYYANYLKSLEAVTVEDVQAMAAKYIKPDNAHILVVGNKKEVASKLKFYGADALIHYVDYLGNPILPSVSPIPPNTTSKTVLAKYINATGGEKKWRKTKRVASKFLAETGGLNMIIEKYQEIDEKACTKMIFNEQVMQHKVINGTKGFELSPEGKNEITEADIQDEYVSLAILPELKYDEMGYKTQLLNIEKVDGQDAYVIEITSPTGLKYTDYFAVESGLKLRSVKREETSRGPMIVVSNYADYKEIKGVKFPHSLTVQAGPQKIIAKAESIIVNKKIDKEIFNVD